ncbi:unnamed protein product [Toxocara canis]|uniref:Uncharacterized protein n=1 Tax=Toxocara canis TaxID=6265 RepID=A0A183VA51_TOXCA|nr:unnamed protein product [Toxocara canis]
MTEEHANGSSVLISTLPSTIDPALMECTRESVNRDDWIQELNTSHAVSCASKLRDSQDMSVVEIDSCLIPL